MKFTGRIRVPKKLTASFPALKLPLSGGYEEGYADGRTAGYTEGEKAATAAAEAHNTAILTDCNAVLPDKGVETADTLEQVPQRIGEIDYMPNPLLYAKSIAALYSSAVFPSGYEIKIVAPNYNGSLQNMFYNAKGVRKITVDVPTGVGCMVYGFANGCENLEEIVLPDGIHFTNWNYFARDCTNLKRIIGRIDCSGHAPSNINNLERCKNLEEVYFMPGTIDYAIHVGYSPKLINVSVQSIIDGLADLTGQTAQTLTIHATVGAKLTQAQKDAITAKNWTLVY